MADERDTLAQQLEAANRECARLEKVVEAAKNLNGSFFDGNCPEGQQFAEGMKRLGEALSALPKTEGE